jgi:hypothetical protein
MPKKNKSKIKQPKTKQAREQQIANTLIDYANELDQTIILDTWFKPFLIYKRDTLNIHTKLSYLTARQITNEFKQVTLKYSL